jgi:hypothetical protein
LDPEQNTLELLLALGFTVYSKQGCFRAQPTQAQKKVVDGKNLTWQKWIMFGQDWKGICLLFLGGPHLFKMADTNGSPYFQSLQSILS